MNYEDGDTHGNDERQDEERGGTMKTCEEYER